MSDLLKVTDLRVKFGSGGDTVVAVDDVTVSVPRGGTLGLVGESGSGKSTLGRAVAGLVPISSGLVIIEGKTVASPAGYSRQGAGVQMVFQNPYSSLNPRMTIGEALVEAASVVGDKDRAGRRLVALQMLKRVGLDERAFDRYPHQFSGGQRQRLAIARSLSARPRLLILDEVTSALDVSVQASILNLLLDLQRELGLTYLFISHNLAVVRHVSDRVAVMYLGQVVEQGLADQILNHPRHPYTEALLESIPQFEAAERAGLRAQGEIPDPRKPPTGCRFRTRCPIGPLTMPERAACITDDPQPLGKLSAYVACHFPLGSPVRASEPLGR